MKPIRIFPYDFREISPGAIRHGMEISTERLLDLLPKSLGEARASWSMGQCERAGALLRGKSITFEEIDYTTRAPTGQTATARVHLADVRSGTCYLVVVGMPPEETHNAHPE